MRFQLQIQRAGLMGQGVGYDSEGNIYFVPGTVPGDMVEVDVADVRKKYRDAELVQVLTPSSSRRDPECSHFPVCGGCDWLHWEYPAQLHAKEEILKHVLERGELVPEKFLPIVGARQPEGYRNRIQLRRRGSQLGFLKKRSQELVDIESCRIADPRLNEEISRLRAEPTEALDRTKIELYVREDGSVARVTNRPHAAEGFAQVNILQNEVLQAIVTGHIEQRQSRKVLELFCGNGNFTRHYGPFVEEVIGVDSSEAALQDARGRRQEKDARKILFLQSWVNRGLTRKLPQEFRNHYDTLVLDPPRLGAGTDLSDFVHPGLKTIIYISCSPVSFSQDVQPLKSEFALAQVQAVDMFPHTRHIEFVARFERRS